MVEIADLVEGLAAIAASGNTLNCQELLGLKAGLAALKAQEEIQAAYLWGKVLGTKSNYYIAYSLVQAPPDAEKALKLFYFSGEDFKFQALHVVSQEAADQIIALGQEDQPFTGSPARTLIAGAGEATGDEPPEGDAPPPPLTELDRLSLLVNEIDFDTAVVPKGSFTLNEALEVTPDDDFKGLQGGKETGLESYGHLRLPAGVKKLSRVARPGASTFQDFMDGLEDDLPKGCWAVRQDAATSTVTLRSLIWQGYAAFHTPGTAKFGSLYIGFGSKTRDLGFLL